jgi:hypothetical protein
VLLYHNTFAASAILRDGFRDGEGSYLTDQPHQGVWLSDRPLDINEGAVGDVLLCIEIPEQAIAPWEWVGEPSMGYREFLAPAELVNRFGPPVVAEGKPAPPKPRRKKS